MPSLFWFVVGVALGLAGCRYLVPRLLPLVAQRFPALGRLLERIQARLSLPAKLATMAPRSALQARIEAAIADLELQIKASPTDRDRNAIRLAILREVLGS